MRKMKTSRIAAMAMGVVAILACGGAFAQPERFDALGGGFDEQAQRIRSELATGQRYSEISPEQRSEVLGLLDSIESQLGSVDTVDRLTPRAKAEVFSQQERVRALLGQAAADSRLVCQRERPSGTRRSITVCRTVAELRGQRNEAETWMRGLQRNPEATK
ncbi:hypothetical protein [Luteimonas huabeiensis]|uniref:hypothetical protein n=1 Tax=Luteimonas huabeiensis TaxID=1244513 RepID=UPI0004654D64|nr:hypothetical protein [Luteimonas huabeiensis]